METSKINRFSVRFGQMVRDKRKNMGLSQEELAEEINASTALIGQIERAETKPSIETFFELVDYLGIDPRAAFYEYPIDDSDYLELCTIASQMQPHQRKLLLDIAKVVKKQDE